MVDYKQLLWKYMNHVGEEEGVTYWQHDTAEGRFTDEEFEALQEINDMERPEWAR